MVANLFFTRPMVHRCSFTQWSTGIHKIQISDGSLIFIWIWRNVGRDGAAGGGELVTLVYSYLALPRHMLSTSSTGKISEHNVNLATTAYAFTVLSTVVCCVWPQDFWAQCSFHDCGLHSDTTEHFSSELDITIQRDTDQRVIRSSVHISSLWNLFCIRTRGVPSV